MKAEDVYSGVKRFAYNHDYKLQNVFVHGWEADYFSVTSSAYTYEFEVKTSRSDFFADFKKPKHNFFKNFEKGHGIYVTSPGGSIGGLHLYTSIDVRQFNGKTCPNKFFYVCPCGLIQPHEVPKYAGLIYIMDMFMEARIIKKAPYLHKDKFDHKTMLFNKYYWLSVEQEKEINRLKMDIEDLKHSLQLTTKQETTDQTNRTNNLVQSL